jgi:hypothetical protein
VACKVVSAHAEPKQIAVAGVAAAAILLDASASLAFTNVPTAAPDASTLYKKVEPERASKTRFDGTEVARLKAQAGKGGGKTAPSPKAASSKSAPSSKSSKKKSSKKKSDSSASSGGALAAVVALGGLFAANATRGGDSSSLRLLQAQARGWCVQRRRQREGCAKVDRQLEGIRPSRRRGYPRGPRRRGPGLDRRMEGQAVN